MQKFHLYFDDTGSRDPDSASLTAEPRMDGMDCFAFGGILIAEENIETVLRAHKTFCTQTGISYPLHSWAIRGGRGKFAWLKKQERKDLFLPSLEKFILSLPIITIACVIHRPGYVRRYKDKYREQLWLMCQTAFCIILERAAKFADQRSRRLEVFYEESGKKENQDIERYYKKLKAEGLPFASTTSGIYSPLGAPDFRRILWGKVHRKTKKTPMIQIADLVLYPMAKSAYTPAHRPYQNLKKAGKLIDCYLDEKDLPTLGIKFSCFDQPDNNGT